MPMNTALLNALKEIVLQHGGGGTLSDARRVKSLLADLAAGEPRPQKNALVACIEQGFPAMLQNVAAHERPQAKKKLAERLNQEEGLDMALCTDALDLLEAALFEPGGGGAERTGSDGIICPSCGTPLPKEARFCLSCGTAVSSGVPQPAPAVLKETWCKLHALKGHNSGVRSVAYSPDGKRIASGSDDRTIIIWDAQNGCKLYTLEGHSGTVYSVAYSPDGKRIASGSGNTIVIWAMAWIENE